MIVLAKNIMFQGTGSSVGKSLLTAAWCRILKEDGFSTAPFKSQNMALNSFVTKDGKEMGRAQVVQAEAAKIEPMVEMNPILLKPTSDKGSQVILNGKVHKNMVAEEYHTKKIEFKELVKDAYNKLDFGFEALVIEGAGSPAEINLRENDLVNMGLAEMVDAPVVLVGDIDRGGVFASIYGTIMLLEPHERERIKGFIINKFRGDVEILKPGIRMLEEKINIPCFGVVPYMDINIDDEDSVTTRFTKKVEGDLVVGIIKLPYISNFSDFTPLELERDLSVRYISHKDKIEDVDLIIIPGSKNTLKDMEYLHNSGIKEKLIKCHRKDIPIIGICGGYQMLGHEIIDPNNTESDLHRINGLSLLDIETVIEDSKETKQTIGKIVNEFKLSSNLVGESVTGYEIHMGKTKLFENAKPFIKLDNELMDGGVNVDGNVFGTYLHGIFENDNFRRSIIQSLKRKNGVKNDDEMFNYKEYKDKEYNKLADIARNNLDVDKLKEIMGL